MRSNNITGPKVTTADATLTTILTYNIPSNTGICGRVLVNGRNTTTNRVANTIIVFGAQNQAGTAAVLGTPVVQLTLALGSDAAMNAVLVTLAATGGQLLVQVQGIIATNIQWQASMEVLGAD